jgi:SAM-dependent methyltransferase
MVTEVDARVSLPDRYQSEWNAPFRREVFQRLRPGVAVLDIGAGRQPSVDRGDRPEQTHWVGLDLDASELKAAGAGAYDECIAGDVAVAIADLEGRFDLALSWQVLEHVRPLDQAIENVHGYLKEGGTFVSLLSGSWSAFGVLNRMLPAQLGVRLVERVMRRSANDHPVFPAYYDQCYGTGLLRLFAAWRDVRIRPLYRGASYFHFSRPLQELYLAYENAVSDRRLANLATHYLVVATK